jgi:molybdate transport system regulatory protein
MWGGAGAEQHDVDLRRMSGQPVPMTVMPSHSSAVLPSGRVSIRLDLAGGARIGPGKVALLEAVARTGSISAAGRALRMSYRRAWELVEDLNRHLGAPVVATAAGGAGGGGARLTELGIALVAEYRALEAETTQAAAARLAALDRARGPR